MMMIMYRSVIAAYVFLAFNIRFLKDFVHNFILNNEICIFLLLYA